MKKIRPFSRSLLGATVAILMLPAMAQADIKVYGKISMSADGIDSGSAGHGVSSNSSRIGFKGKENLNYGLKAIWKIESELDISSASTAFKSRNRYLGLNMGKSTLIGGYHDTPFKTLGGKVDVLSETIADRRGVLGMDYAGGYKKFDVRAENSVMYINKSVKGLDFRLMRSAGSPNATEGDTTPITSTSALYKTSQFMVGAAYEVKEVEKISGLRLLAGVAFGATRITGIYESLDFGDVDNNAGWDRTVMGGSVSHKMGATSIKLQAYFADDLESVADSGGRMYAGGIYHKLAKPFTTYLVVARIENDTNGAYTLTGSGHGDKYRPDVGGIMHGVSVGAVYKF